MPLFDFLPQLPLPTNALALFGVLLLAGALGGELVLRVISLPRLTGYVLTGLALGPSGLDVLDGGLPAHLRVFVDIGLGLVLFELGRRLDLEWLNRDRWLAVMAFWESLLSFACMFAALAWFDIPLLPAAAAAGIGISSSPAIVLLVAREQRAEGQVTERALNLVAINSVVAFVLVTLLLSWMNREYDSSWLTILLHSTYILAGSCLAGTMASLATLIVARWLGKQAELHLVLVVASLFVLIGAAESLKLSVLICLVTFGIQIRNLDYKHALMPVDIGRYGQAFFIVLFVASGAMLSIADLIPGGAIAIVYILARFVGKSVGVLCCARLSGIRPGSGGLLSIALLPMSGIALAMTHGAGSQYPGLGAGLAGIVFAATLMLELLGPLAVQFALRLAGEVHQAGQSK